MSTILHLSELYAEETWSPAGSQAIDLTGIEGTSCYCSPEAEEALRKRLADLPHGGLFWIDTGDYHYISKLRLEHIREPFVLVLYDNHPDDQPSAFGSGLLSCGGWVQTARDTLPLLKKVFLNTLPEDSSLPVFLSLDLDVLSPAFARTDWDQGSMSLEELLSAIDRIMTAHRVLGVDVCGGITAAKGGTAEDRRINAGTRAVLEGRLGSLQSL
ncbi:MAG: hypothetical protein J5533_09030 [Bacteroidales bacterium]|nr:hypothetical protein [Bacteroidales bacterium]